MKELIGKTIKNIEVIGSYDLYGDDERVTDVTKITCTDGTEVYLLGDGGDGNFYCTTYTAKLNKETNRFEHSGRAFGNWCK